MASPVGTATGEVDRGVKKQLFKLAMQGKWNEVVNIYREHSWARKVKITRSEDTALHIAVSDNQEQIVKELVDIISSSGESKKILRIENEPGKTPLHIAASMGSVTMCRCIAEVDPKLVGARNHDGETPFFMAALYGNKEAFLCLHNICDTGEGYSYRRRNNGDTILHCAINGDYFDLAYQIITLYKDLVNSVNEQGLSPLHILASKPSAFRSGSHLAGFQKFIYHCIFVDELTAKPIRYQSSRKTYEEEENPKYPENYQTCVNFFRLLQKVVPVVTARKEAPKIGGEKDAKNPTVKNQVTGREEAAKKGGEKDIENPTAENQGYQSTNAPQGQQLFPPNYFICFEFIKLISKAMLVILGFGFTAIKKLRNEKEKHTWSVQIMNELLRNASMYEYDDNARNPQQSQSLKDEETMLYEIVDGGSVSFHSLADIQQMIQATDVAKTNQEDQKNGKNGTIKNRGEEGKIPDQRAKKETPILIAAKNGVTEIVEKILELFPVAIHDMNTEKKNIVLLAVENRQPHVYKLLLERNILRDIVFRKVDDQGNSALHLAAKFRQISFIPAPALLMQWEIKWFKFVKDSLPPNYLTHHNIKGQTAEDVFTNTHKELVSEGGKWLTETSNSCFLVATIIATMTYTTSVTVPGGLIEGTGVPTFEEQPAFFVFAISSLIALCFSVISLVTFLSILTSRHLEEHFGSLLPKKFLLALSSLLISIVFMLVSFCSAHFFVLREKLELNAYPLYAVSCLGVALFVVLQFPLYFDFLKNTCSKVPQRSLGYRSSYM